MSTLTKVLVVLVTLAGTFLCGIVVLYAASATNYRAKHDDVVTDNKALNANVMMLQTQLNEGLKSKQDEIDTLRQQLNRLIKENSDLQAEALTLKAAKDVLQERITGWSGTMQQNTAIVADLQQQLKTTRDELDKVRNELVTDRGQLSQVRAAFEEKTLQLKALERENMRLVEEKTAIENRLGGRVSAVMPVTAPAGSVRPALGPTPKVVLEGRIKEVRMDSMLASLNMGSANGVRAGDVLHVIRGDQFICDISVTNVDVDTCVGKITMLKSGFQPTAGDIVTNKL